MNIKKLKVIINEMVKRQLPQFSEEGDRNVTIRSNEDWKKLINKLIQDEYSWKSGVGLKPDRGLTQMSNYVKFPYIVYINQDNKTVDYRGEHSVND